VVSCVEAAFQHPGEYVASNPGPVVQQDVLVTRRRSSCSRTPTTRCPPRGADTSLPACPDAAGLSSAQLAFLRGLLDQLDATIQHALRTEPGVRVAELRHAFDGHQWCSPDPWAYGPSVLLQNRASRAPFHPTVRGQQVIAADVLRKFND
jgi:hypothetical protein